MSGRKPVGARAQAVKPPSYAANLTYKRKALFEAYHIVIHGLTAVVEIDVAVGERFAHFRSESFGGGFVHPFAVVQRYHFVFGRLHLFNQVERGVVDIGAFRQNLFGVKPYYVALFQLKPFIVVVRTA